MKSLLLTLFVISSPFFFLAQNGYKLLESNNPLKSTSYYTYEKPNVGKLIWHEDFNREKWQSTVVGDTSGYLLDSDATLPAGWNFVDSTGNDFFWHWSDVGPRGIYTSINDINADGYLYPNNSLLEMLPKETSIDNGFMLMESDFFNSPNISDWYTVDMNSYIEFGPFDFSEYQSVIFNCKIFDRYCCDIGKGTFLEISSDYEPGVNQGHWTSYKLREWFDGDNRHAEELDYYVNVTNSSAHYDSVYFRVWKRNASHYYVIIDDIRIFEGPKNNIKITNAWADYISPSNSTNEFVGGYTMFPKDAVSSFKQFRAAIWNSGSNTAENTQVQVKLFKDDVLLDSLVSAGINISYNERDTLSIATDFSPTELGFYQVSMTVGADFVDEFPNNNSWGYEFETTEHTFSRVRHGYENEFTSTSTRDWYGGGYDGDMLLVRYDLDHEGLVEFSGIRVYIYPTTDSAELASIANGQYQMRACVYSLPIGGASYTEIIDENLVSDYYAITPADLGTWVYLPFLYEGNSYKSKGEYYVGIEQYTGTEAEMRFRIGADQNGIVQPIGSNLIYQSSSDSPGFGWVNKNFTIDLVINKPKIVTLSINYDMSFYAEKCGFDPDVDTVYVAGSFNNWLEPGKGAIMAEYNAETQIATAKIELEASISGITVEYKGYLNSGWLGGEWQDAPNRSIVLENQDVVVNIIFGDGICNGIGIESNKDLIVIYPNPFNNYLALEDLKEADQIQIFNSLGQLVKAVPIIANKQVINTADLPKGLYFILVKHNIGILKAQSLIKN